MRLIISGDKSRYHFFRYIIDNNIPFGKDSFFTERLEENDVFITSNINKTGDNIYYSSKIPINTELYFPSEYIDLFNVFRSDDRVILFDEFPYATESDMERLDAIFQCGIVSQISIVLFKNKIQCLDTDISTDNMALKEAENKYKSKSITVYNYSVGDSPSFLIYDRDIYNTLHLKSFKEKLNMASSKLEFFDSTYELLFDYIDSDLIDFDVLAGFFAYDNSLSFNNVWKIYYNRSYKYYFENNYLTREFCKDLYNSSIKDICIWNFEIDFNQLFNIIKNEYSDTFKNFSKLLFDGKRETYDDFLNAHQEKVLEFKVNIQNFFKYQIKNIIKNRIQRTISRMEELIEC